MKILYLMWIDWRWIWQRPQELAKKLNLKYDVTVVFPQNIMNRQKMQKNNPYPRKYKKIYVIPFYNKIHIIETVVNWGIRLCLRDVRQYDAIWVGHPLFEKFIPKEYKGMIIYDCMDNHVALCGSIEKGKRIEREEINLVKRAELVFVTSNLLRKYIEKFVDPLNTKIVLVRNGYDYEKTYMPEIAVKKARYKLGYIGTISEWMDYSTILQSIEQYNNIEYHLVGLVSGNNYVKRERLYYEGVIEHKELYEKIKDYDCLVMPFIVNDIVSAVDPVKLYEYISFGKCIISVYYPEIERFGEYVYFYHSPEEYCKLVDELAKSGFPPKYSREHQSEFLTENTWERRIQLIEDAIEQKSDKQVF